jgi:hypothetical protein
MNEVKQRVEERKFIYLFCIMYMASEGFVSWLAVWPIVLGDMDYGHVGDDYLVKK